MESTLSSIPPPTGAPPRRRSWLRLAGIILLCLVVGCGVAAAATAFWVKHNLYAGPLRPLSLSQGEQGVLAAKLRALEAPPAAPRSPAPGEEARTLMLSQKEINAYLASQNLGDTVRVELGQGRVMATMVVPVPKDAGVPLLSGTTLRLRVDLEAKMTENQPFLLKLADVRLGGISLPSAWLGDIKGVNLLAENVENDPAMQRFLAGIQEIEIRPEGLRVLLKE